ncbi:hypothetical protein [Streptosporangium carneum]|uniref:Uncharacterized protein n=1 Tax=Streptosporangium carneum TaxID=47481 RepID=A0A9W6HY00_9ACTN|nr:hypothetical protein [Streptosporangium carneum]GLK08402.1 hypothetical protein GCM10017600_18070 [Streptosporangium carneum]
MGGSDVRVLVVVVIAVSLFLVGRRFQRTVDTWAGWGKAIKAAAEAAAKIPGAKAAAWAAVRGMIVVGLGALVLFAVLTNALRQS